MLINAIYRATEGEGIHLGSPQIFVRFQGCHLGCINCDSKDTWDFSLGEKHSLDYVLQQVSALSFHGKIKRVSITGGDPTHPQHEKDVLALVHQLKEKKYWVNLEASGTRVVHEIFDVIDFISWDYKTPSSGVKDNLSLLEKLAQDYPGRFQIK